MTTFPNHTLIIEKYIAFLFLHNFSSRVTLGLCQYKTFMFPLDCLFTIVAPTAETSDTALEAKRRTLFPLFVNKWTGYAHLHNCKHTECSRLLNIDGNWKINRLKCMNDSFYLCSNEIEQI